MPVSPALAGLSLEIKVKAEASPHEATDAENGSSPDSYSPHDSSNPSSEDGSDAVSRNGSNESSPNSSPPKSPESLQTAFPDNEKLKTSNLIDTCLQDQTDPCPTAISGTSSQLDSKAPTLCGSASPTSSDTASTDDSPFGQLSMICDDCLEGGPEVQNVIVWHGGDPDLSTQEYCHIYYKVGAGILSPDSLISSFSATSDQIKYPEGSQNVAAYALPLQEDNCIRTSCDRIENTGRWRREYDGFIDEPKRAGGPNLCSEPHRMIEMDKDNPLRRALEDFILVQTIMSLLTEKKSTRLR
ncbi:hypothetical protein N7475_008894 [Penicillium sp. IBT 31633x]|nr:hypothetical protein N7475_008894 [Penicillium sp. IBT 31633x]